MTTSRDIGHLIGDDHPLAKLRAADVLTIRHRFAQGETIEAIHTDYPQVGWSAIQKAATGQTWKHLEGEEIAAGLNRWTEAEVAYLRAHPDEPPAKVAERLDRTRAAVEVMRWRIQRGDA